MFLLFCFFPQFCDDCFFFFFLAACVPWLKSSTNLWLAEPQTKLVQTLIDSVLFYQMSIVSDECIYFWACPHLFKEFAQCVRLRWRQGSPLFFVLFLFWGFQAENQKWDTKQPLTTICEVTFFCEKSDLIFFQLKENGLWHLSSQKYLAVCRVLISCNSLRVFFFSFLLTHVFLGSHCMSAHEGCWTLTPGVCLSCLWTWAGHSHCLCRVEATVSSQACSPWVLPRCWQTKLTF